MKDLEKKIRRRIERAEALSGKPGLFRKLAKELPMGDAAIRSVLLKAKRGSIYWELVFDKTGAVMEKALLFSFDDNGVVGIRQLCDGDKADFRIESDLNSPGRKFGKFLHKFGLSRRVPKSMTSVIDGDVNKARERLIERFVEMNEP
jgi:hypothetical protein